MLSKRNTACLQLVDIFLIYDAFLVVISELNNVSVLNRFTFLYGVVLASN